MSFLWDDYRADKGRMAAARRVKQRCGLDGEDGDCLLSHSGPVERHEPTLLPVPTPESPMRTETPSSVSPEAENRHVAPEIFSPETTNPEAAPAPDDGPQLPANPAPNELPEPRRSPQQKNEGRPTPAEPKTSAPPDERDEETPLRLKVPDAEAPATDDSEPELPGNPLPSNPLPPKEPEASRSRRSNESGAQIAFRIDTSRSSTSPDRAESTRSTTNSPQIGASGARQPRETSSSRPASRNAGAPPASGSTLRLIVD